MNINYKVDGLKLTLNSINKTIQFTNKQDLNKFLIDLLIVDGKSH